MADWRSAQLGDVARIEIGGTPSRNVSRFWSDSRSGHPWLSIADLRDRVVLDTAERITDAGVRESNVKPIPAGTTVMSFKLTIGRAAITGVDMYSNEAIAAFHPDADRVDSTWLYHVLPRSAARAVVDTAVKGITLNKAKLQRLGLHLPPLHEQQQIAEILDTVDEAIRKTEQIIAKLEQVKQGLLHDLLTRGIDDNGELRDPEGHPEQFKDSQLGRIPRTWDVEPCGQLFDVQLGKMMSPSAVRGPNQRPYLRNQNVLWDALDLSDVATMHFDEVAMSKFRLQPGDLLACEGRFIGRCAIWQGELSECAYQKALHRIRARTSKIGTGYMQLFMMLRFRYDPGFIQKMTHESTIPHLPLEKLVVLPVLVPPRAEQERIVVVFRGLDAEARSERDRYNKLRLLKSGLMEDLLAGRVRVPPAASNQTA